MPRHLHFIFLLPLLLASCKPSTSPTTAPAPSPPSITNIYAVPTNAMSPTIRGPHHVAFTPCPKCGGQLLIDIPTTRKGDPARNQLAICAACFYTTDFPASSPIGPAIGEDHVIVKSAPPHRWDILAFHFKTGDIYIKRLVALPGETVAIDSTGHILINGTDIGSPPGFPKLTFPYPDHHERFPEHALLPDASIHLADDEFFVIGDNALRSYDSRSFGPIHAADIQGVVTGIASPTDRVRNFP